MAPPLSQQKLEKAAAVGAEKEIALPAAAHKEKQQAGYFTDPATGNRVYRLSDEKLCPGGGRHFYSYTNQFSAKGNIVFACLAQPNNEGNATFPIYDSDMTLVAEDAASAARVGRDVADMQWSQTREVLFARQGEQILELDPFGRSHRVAADFGKNIRRVKMWDGTEVGVSGIQALSVGPGDRLMVHLQCRRGDAGCPRDWAVVGVGTYDPASQRYAAIGVPHAPDSGEFDEAQWTQNPDGRIALIYANRPAWTVTADLTGFVKMEDNHGHSGYFAGASGRSYRVSVKNDTVRNPDGTTRVGQVGCKDSSGHVRSPWSREYALYDDATGERALVWGCDVIAGTEMHPEHFSRSIGVSNVFGGSGRTITRFSVEEQGGKPVRVTANLVTYTRSEYQKCGYWAQPRATMDQTGTRFLFDSSMNHPRWPAREVNGKLKNDCRVDVYVAVLGKGK